MLCRRCWIQNKDCICQKAEHIQIPTSHFQHRLIIYMFVIFARIRSAYFAASFFVLTCLQALQRVLALEQHRRSASSLPRRQPHQCFREGDTESRLSSHANVRSRHRVRAPPASCLRSCSQPNTFLFFPSSQSITFPEFAKTASSSMQQGEPSSDAAASDSRASSSFRLHVLPVAPVSDFALSAQDSTLL